MEEPSIASQKELNFSYIAGVFDGEGCISIHKSRNSFVVSVAVEMRDSQAVKKIASLFRVNVSTCFNAEKNYYARRVRLTGAKALRFLRAVYPFLLVKKSQARVAIEMLEYQKSTNHSFERRIIRYSKWAEKCKKLKKSDWIYEK